MNLSLTTTLSNLDPRTDTDDEIDWDGVDSNVTAVSADTTQLVSSDTMLTNSSYCKTLYVAKWPPIVRPGVIQKITDHQSAGLQMSIHAEPLRKRTALDFFEKRIEDKGDQLDERQTRGLAGQRSLKSQLEDLEDIHEAIDRDKERAHKVGVFMTVRAPTKRAADNAASEIKKDLAGNNITAKTVSFLPEESLTTVSPNGSHTLPANTLQPMTTSALAALYPFTNQTIIEEDTGVLWGSHA